MEQRLLFAQRHNGGFSSVVSLAGLGSLTKHQYFMLEGRGADRLVMALGEIGGVIVVE